MPATQSGGHSPGNGKDSSKGNGKDRGTALKITPLSDRYVNLVVPKNWLSFEWEGLHALPQSFKLFISLLMCVLGLCYLTFLGSIWNDTEMKIAMIIEGYGTFDSIELVEHSFKYMYWFLGTFGVTGFVFLLTCYPEKLKRIFAAVTPIFIILDISAAWLIRYHDIFAWQLMVSGFVLATCFLAMFLLIQYDLWLKKDHS